MYFPKFPNKKFISPPIKNFISPRGSSAAVPHPLTYLLHYAEFATPPTWFQRSISTLAHIPTPIRIVRYPTPYPTLFARIHLFSSFPPAVRVQPVFHI